MHNNCEHLRHTPAYQIDLSAVFERGCVLRIVDEDGHVTGQLLEMRAIGNHTGGHFLHLNLQATNRTLTTVRK